MLEHRTVGVLLQCTVVDNIDCDSQQRCRHVEWFGTEVSDLMFMYSCLQKLLLL